VTHASMQAAPPRESAPGPAPVVLIHGVGFGPGTMASLAQLLARAVSVTVHARRGYGPRASLAPATSVAAHVDDLIATVDERHGSVPVALVGVSGGATVALAAALSHPRRVAVAVAHEPAVGSVAPELRALIRRTLAAGGGVALAQLLAGSRTWDSLPATIVEAIERDDELLCADAGAFLSFEPDLPAVPGGVPLICTVGEWSGALRHAIARSLSERTGAPVAVIPRCGHLAQIDAPQAFAHLILDHALVAGTTSDRNKEHPA
jgi:pimeloyl-ACP methyl ester carboxylesterase